MPASHLWSDYQHPKAESGVWNKNRCMVEKVTTARVLKNVSCWNVLALGSSPITKRETSSLRHTHSFSALQLLFQESSNYLYKDRAHRFLAERKGGNCVVVMSRVIVHTSHHGFFITQLSVFPQYLQLWNHLVYHALVPLSA